MPITRHDRAAARDLSRAATLPLALRLASASLLALGLALAATQVEAQEASVSDETAETAATDGVIRSHGYAYFGNLKYPSDFDQLSYVNPDAPKGGELVIATTGTFDSMNPYARQGRAYIYSIFPYESLFADSVSNETLPADDREGAYGLLAESVEYDEGKTYAIFHLRPEAKFSDGTPVTAEDVVFTHNLFLEQGLPSYSSAVKERVPNAEVIDEHTVRFDFAEGVSRRSLVDQVGGTPVFQKKWFDDTGARLDESRLETPPGSGPWLIDDVVPNRRIVLKRNPDYWGADLPINKGRHNYDTIRVEFFGDTTAAFEAFKAGTISYRTESSSRLWATAYDFPAVTRGDVIMEEIPDGNPPAATGFVFNLGVDKLQDRRVREAITLAYNFEWTNASLQYGLYEQRASFAQDTDLQATGVPEGRELEILQSLGDTVPEEMLTEPAIMPHTSSEDRLTDRGNIRTAGRLLEEAGWTVGDDGVRRNEAGETLTLRIPLASNSDPTVQSIHETFAENLSALGIEAQIENMDPSQYSLRTRERDYDMIYDSYAALTGAGTGLRQMYGSEAAEFSLFNPAGLASPLVDALIEVALESESQEEEDAAMMALDRALRWERFQIPMHYSDVSRVAYYRHLQHPEEMPPYAVGVLDFWWIDQDVANELRADGALR
ncbi:peptide ABC transporter substrate-binding protein [Roseivivax halodurans JCM 10272]|uniref:Peptide ABC transporter substrate-binding protein n=1 Tax=Roseivivax halodurans JCM 10272 TaxID=1449350 RepID=X7EJX9_9RHOB|nr:extracellular solute-binding protein [Roseivivax halodurans]ETX15471.1 peptide ABC transporter substrate-binding protein [Roseivivax halodurans JCM 10272]